MEISVTRQVQKYFINTGSNESASEFRPSINCFPLHIKSSSVAKRASAVHALPVWQL